MDIEFHYYVNYIIALQAGFTSPNAYRIAYSAQYIDDNTESYTILQNTNLSQYHHIITQSLNPTLSVKDIISIYPIFHFIPGNELLKSSNMRRDGECRHMTTTPNNKLARNCLITALQSNDIHWIGIASHSFIDTWAHQNFTGLKDTYNAVNKFQNNEVNKIFRFPNYVGHADVLNLPDNPNTIWYDYRLKDMKIDNNIRFLEAAKEIFKVYIKYGGKLLVNKPENPMLQWRHFQNILKNILTSNIDALQDLHPIHSASSRFMNKILGMNKFTRISCYREIAKQMEQKLGIKNTEFIQYDKKLWLQNAVYETSNSINHIANDTQPPQQQEERMCLSDGAKLQYNAGQHYDITEMFKRKVSTLLGIYKNLYMWRSHFQQSDWYLFQEAAKKQHSFLIEKIIKLMQQDISMMKKANT